MISSRKNDNTKMMISKEELNNLLKKYPDLIFDAFKKIKKDMVYWKPTKKQLEKYPDCKLIGSQTNDGRILMYFSGSGWIHHV